MTIDPVFDFWNIAAAGNDRGRVVRAKHLRLTENTTHSAASVDRLMSVAEYFAYEAIGEVKHEYVGGRLYAMAGASDSHVTINGNLTLLLLPLARSKGCRGYGQDMKVEVEIPVLPSDRNRAFRYPDYMITCSDADSERDIKREPTVLVEILSPTTTEIDCVDKMIEYRRIATLQQYWIVHQDKMCVEIHERSGDTWVERIYNEPAAAIAVAGTGGTVVLRDLYIDVALPRKELR